MIKLFSLIAIIGNGSESAVLDYNLSLSDCHDAIYELDSIHSLFGDTVKLACEDQPQPIQ